MFGDIVKVTPSSKVVGDMALVMVSQGLSRQEVEDPAIDVAFPDSVVEMMRGDLGQPPGGFPPALQQKVLKGSDTGDDAPRGRHGAGRSGGHPPGPVEGA
jgi:pyruvate carboxylase